MRLARAALGLAAALTAGCAIGCHRSRAHPPEEPTSTKVELAFTPIPMRRPIRMNLQLQVRWTIATDATPHGGSITTEHRLHRRSASSVGTIVECAPDAPTSASRAQVRYAYDRTYDEREGEGATREDELAGKPLQVVVGPTGSVEVTGLASVAAIEQVLRDYGEVGHPHSLFAASPITAKPGDEAPFADAFIRRFVDGQLEATVFPSGRMQCTPHARFVRSHDGRAFFDVELRTPSSDAAAWWEPSLYLRGELALKTPEGWPTSLHGKGRARRAFATTAGVQTHEGDVELDVDWSY